MGEWSFVSEGWKTVSLHDHCVTRTEEVGPDLVLHFEEDGFDITRDDPLNPTGRHRNTGPAAVVLKHWRWERGAFGPNCFREVRLDNGEKEYIPLPVVPISKNQFLRGLELEVLDFTWEEGVLTLEGSGFLDPPPPGSETGFVEIVLSGQRLLFCWNELPRDSWFQDWPKN